MALDLALLNSLPPEEQPEYMDRVLRDGMLAPRNFKIDNRHFEVTKRESLIYRADEASSDAVRKMAYREHKKRVRINKSKLLKQFRQSLRTFQCEERKGALGAVAATVDHALKSGLVNLYEIIGQFNDAVVGNGIITDPQKTKRVWSIIWQHLPLDNADPAQLGAIICPTISYGNGLAKAGLIASLPVLHGRLLHEPVGSSLDRTTPSEIQYIAFKYARSNRQVNETLRAEANCALALMSAAAEGIDDRNLFEAKRLLDTVYEITNESAKALKPKGNRLSGAQPKFR